MARRAAAFTLGLLLSLNVGCSGSGPIWNANGGKARSSGGSDPESSDVAGFLNETTPIYGDVPRLYVANPDAAVIKAAYQGRRGRTLSWNGRKWIPERGFKIGRRATGILQRIVPVGQWKIQPVVYDRSHPENQFVWQRSRWVLETQASGPRVAQPQLRRAKPTKPKPKPGPKVP